MASQRQAMGLFLLVLIYPVNCGILPSSNYRGGTTMIGKKFGRLTILKQDGKDNAGNKRYECLCECGTIKTISGYHIRQGKIQSCGCLHKERASAYCARTKKTHGLSATPEYHTWESMKQRCLNPNDKDYVKWGGRGITVCNEWIDSFEQFFADMGPRPDKHTLDRKDVNGPYTKDNCRWITHKQQQRNKRTNVHITYNNESRCIAEWIELLGIPSSTMHYKLRVGKSLDTIINEHKKKQITS